MGKKITKDAPRKGDLVEVYWFDIAGDTGEDSSRARCPLGITPGYFLKWKTLKAKTKIGGKLYEPGRILICESTKHPHGGDWGTGWDAYPVGVVKEVRIARRAKEYA